MGLAALTTRGFVRRVAQLAVTLLQQVKLERFHLDAAVGLEDPADTGILYGCLSPLLVQQIYRVIRRLKEEARGSMLLVEQNANMALDVADFGYVLEGGRIVLEGSALRLRANEDVKEFYLGIRDVGVRGVRRWKRRKQWR